IVRGTNDYWALPADSRLWSNYVFSCDFKETHGRKCTLQLQLKDANGKFIEYVKVLASNQWDTITHSLDRCTPPTPGALFDAGHVREFVVNVQMRETNVTYEAYFYNIRLAGPPDLGDTFEDRPVGQDFSRIAPWQAYAYDEPHHNDVLLDKGVQQGGSD